MNLALSGQAALVTGAGRGIGAAIVRELARAGCDVALVEFGAFAEAESLAGELRDEGRRSIAIRADVSDFAGAERTVAAAVDALGRIDHLVCNAGITRDALSWKMTEEQWDQVIDVNLKGCFAYCRAVAGPFRKQLHGRIVNIASVNGLRGKAGQSNYAASKAGIIALTRTLARELGPKGVNVNCIAPGMVRTGMTANLPPAVLESALADTPLGRMAEPEDVARVVVFLCSEASRHITGEVIRVDGGQLA
ncbi:MAG: 3-oxoacyl-ACP reductase FabG [Gemmatimonadaceae bacterium]|nr:3-oxoacyl-ACP reductase FabG [Gemmatimonadaceae bacterium]